MKETIDGVFIKGAFYSNDEIGKINNEINDVKLVDEVKDLFDNQFNSENNVLKIYKNNDYNLSHNLSIFSRFFNFIKSYL